MKEATRCMTPTATVNHNSLSDDYRIGAGPKLGLGVLHQSDPAKKIVEESINPGSAEICGSCVRLQVSYLRASPTTELL